MSSCVLVCSPNVFGPHPTSNVLDLEAFYETPALEARGISVSNSSLSGGGSELSFTDCGPIRHSFLQYLLSSFLPTTEETTISLSSA